MGSMTDSDATSSPLWFAHSAQNKIDSVVEFLRKKLGGRRELNKVARQVAKTLATPAKWDKLPRILNDVQAQLTSSSSSSSSLVLAGLSLTLLSFFVASARAYFYAVYVAAKAAGVGVQAALLAVVLVYVFQAFDLQGEATLKKQKKKH